jgi:hypothetical protein
METPGTSKLKTKKYHHSNKYLEFSQKLIFEKSKQKLISTTAQVSYNHQIIRKNSLNNAENYPISSILHAAINTSTFI